MAPAGIMYLLALTCGDSTKTRANVLFLMSMFIQILYIFIPIRTYMHEIDKLFSQSVSTHCHCSISKICMYVHFQVCLRTRNGEKETYIIPKATFLKCFYFRYITSHTIIIVSTKAERKLTPFTFSAKLAVVSRNALFI